MTILIENPRYYKGLNRFVPLAQLGRGIFIPKPPFNGTFERLKRSDEIRLSRVFSSKPIARLVVSNGNVPWNSPTVIQEVFPRRRGYIVHQSALAMSDYRYLQLAAQRKDIIPVLDPRDGLIYDLTPHLNSAQLRFYRKVMCFTSMRTRDDYQPQRRIKSDRPTATPASDHILPTRS